jgi:hypothetical protein
MPRRANLSIHTRRILVSSWISPFFSSVRSDLCVSVISALIRVEMNQEKRKKLRSEVQKILAKDLPYLPMWFSDVVSVHRRSLGALELPSTGNYNFLTTLHTRGN